MREYEAARQVEAERYLRAATNSTAQWQVALSQATDGVPQLLEDYDPPPVNTTEAGT